MAMTPKSTITLQNNMQIAREAFTYGIKLGIKNKLPLMREINSHMFESHLRDWYHSNKRHFNTLRIRKAFEAHPDLIKFYRIEL